MNMEDAFWQVCADAEVPERPCVSLYKISRWYGGPEEGGWWGTTVALVSYLRCTTRDEAQDRANAVQDFARKATEEARKANANMCLSQCEAAWARGMDPDEMYPGEPDDADEFVVYVENVPGEHQYQSSKFYS